MKRRPNLLLLTSVLALVGCGGLGLNTLERLFPPGTFGGGSSSPFVGQWTLTSLQVGSTTESCPATISSNGINYSCEAIVRSFLASGDFSDTAPIDQIGTGTWSVSGTNDSTLTTIKNNVSESGTVGFTADGKQFVETEGLAQYTWKKG